LVIWLIDGKSGLRYSAIIEIFIILSRNCINYKKHDYHV